MELAEKARSSPGVESASFTRVRRGLFIGIVKTRRCPCYELALAECNVVQVVDKGDGWLEWTVILGSRNELGSLINRLEESGVGYEIKSIERVGHEPGLTNRQEEVLRTAYELGFYNVPRDVSLRDLSRLFGVSTRALSEILRRAEKKAIHQALNRVLSNEGEG